MKILFVCRGNRFRSKIAEAYFRKINRNKNIKAESSGVFKGIRIAKNVLDTGKKLKLKIKRETRGLREEYLKDFDLIIIVANNVPLSLFRGAKKLIIWKIPDTSEKDKKGIERISKIIMKKVEQLNKKLKEKRK